MKAAYKAKFTLEFANVRAQWVRGASEPLTLIDVGGKIDEKNRLIMSHATHALILAGDMSQVPAWQEFCSELNLKVVALIYSDYNGVADRLQAEVPMLEGSIHFLERGQDVSCRPMVQALAQRLVDLSSAVMLC